ncbi:SRPBCC family protein [Streptomyces sp. CSDS2]|uniref:SRPBCC family protein n=1 Tax=Streptomyces sp. CSDS2 TaxID=3055051 RepID=UPI0025AF648E|nr:SRPBCC family protein [Streptomyces sp. CSDS2]MDN3259567.1 SRPBCC family protein [Streptomyces sp. CSDS2]
MEHQVFVQASTDRLGAALTDPARVARAVPGLQRDAGAGPITGRLKLRVGGHSVTYRGTARVTPRADGTYGVEADATEARGTGSVKLSLTLRLADAEDGCTVTAEGTATASGRITELPAESVTTAATRLLSRFLESLAVEETPADDEPAVEGEPPVDAHPGAGKSSRADGSPEAHETDETDETDETAENAENAETHETHEAHEPQEADDADQDAVAGEPHRSVFDTEVPPPSLDRDADDLDGDGDADADDGTVEADAAEDTGPVRPDVLAEDFDGTGEPLAEAAHARRTMIGRSAEEVDHAPPRGRYAPVPAPQTVVGNPALRWAAPAAAFALASAIVVTRALRRRR